MRLQGKAVVITGGGSGIGKAMAERFRTEGAANILVADLDGETSVGTASMTLTIAGRLPAHLQLKSAGPA